MTSSACPGVACAIDTLLCPISIGQVYFPIVHSLYPGHDEVGTGSGTYRDTGYGMSCLYVEVG
jgi:hypothetical protein